jgi:hypothetical protein
MNIANSEAEYGHIRQATKGIVFCSHPHRGPALSTFLRTFICPEAFTAAFEADCEIKIPALLELNSYFISTAADLTVLSFWEVQGVLFYSVITNHSEIWTESNRCEIGKRK